MKSLLLAVTLSIAVDCSIVSSREAVLDGIPSSFDPARYRRCFWGYSSSCVEMIQLFLSHIERDLAPELSLAERLNRSLSKINRDSDFVVSGIISDALVGDVYAILSRAGLLRSEGYLANLLNKTFGDIFTEAFEIVRSNEKAAKDSEFWRSYLEMSCEDDIRRIFQSFVDHLQENKAELVRQICAETAVPSSDPRVRTLCRESPNFQLEINELFRDVKTLRADDLLRRRVKQSIEAFIGRDDRSS